MKWNEIPDDNIIEETINSLKARGINAEAVDTGKQAKEKVMSLLPVGSRVLTSTSITLETIGVHDEIEATDKVVSVRKQYMALNHEKDADKIRELRSTPEIVIGSVHAVTKKGEVLIASNTGSQIGPYAYSAKKVIWVVGAQKIVKDLDEGLKRLYDFVLPLESERLKKLYGVPSFVSKLLIINRDVNPNRLIMILVKEKLGF